MADEPIILQLAILEENADLEQLDALTNQVMVELLELGVESVNRQSREEPQKGSKGDPFTIGALLLVAAPALLPNLLSFLQAWSLRSENRKIKIKTPTGLEVEFIPEKRLSQPELLALVGELSNVHTGKPAPAEKE